MFQGFPNTRYIILKRIQDSHGDRKWITISFRMPQKLPSWQGFDSGFAKVPCGQFQSQELERRRFWNWGGAPEREAPQSALVGVGGEAPGIFLCFWILMTTKLLRKMTIFREESDCPMPIMIEDINQIFQTISKGSRNRVVHFLSRNFQFRPDFFRNFQFLPDFSRNFQIFSEISRFFQFFQIFPVFSSFRWFCTIRREPIIAQRKGL